MNKGDKMKRCIKVHMEIEGLHHWATCNEAEVNYLATPHRHIFHINAVKEVTHGDRDIEFIKLKHEMQLAIENEFYDRDKRICDFGASSCEHIAEMLIKNYGLSSCEVLEDGENGAIVIAEELI